MRITQEFINSLSPVEITFIKVGIDKLYKEKVTKDTTNYDNLSLHVDHCPHCGSSRYVKNGFNPKHKQKYRCKECKAVFMATTGTLFTHSRTSYDNWSTFIAGELNSLTLQQQSVATGLSVTTCFNMRHKLYQAASFLNEKAHLDGQTELDMAYTKINLKGTKRENMPRYSKRRGKHKSTIFTNSLHGTSRHKVCIVSAIDENDNILLKIGGLGRESFEMINRFKKNFSKTVKIVSDDSHSIQTFVNENHFKHDVIPSNAFMSENGNTVSSVNELHSEVKNMMRHKHGVSTRHLQGYLDWLVFRKHLKYTLEMRKWKPEAYMETMFEQIPFVCADITKQAMPISLFEAYGEYRYGIFSNATLIN